MGRFRALRLVFGCVVILLGYLNAVYLRFGVGVLLVLYTVYGLARPAIKPMKIGILADLGIGVVNGLVGGLTGLGGVISTISCQWRGWTRDVQRAVFQPVLFGPSWSFPFRWPSPAPSPRKP